MPRLYPLPKPPVVLSSTAVDFRTSTAFFRAVGSSVAFTLQNVSSGQIVTLTVQNTQPSTAATITWSYAGGSIYSDGVAQTIPGGRRAVFTFLCEGANIYVTSVLNMG